MDRRSSGVLEDSHRQGERCHVIAAMLRHKHERVALRCTEVHRTLSTLGLLPTMLTRSSYVSRSQLIGQHVSLPGVSRSSSLIYPLPLVIPTSCFAQQCRACLHLPCSISSHRSTLPRVNSPCQTPLQHHSIHHLLPLRFCVTLFSRESLAGSSCQPPTCSLQDTNSIVLARTASWRKQRKMAEVLLGARRSIPTSSRSLAI
jgi:hypothetical protein